MKRMSTPRNETRSQVNVHGRNFIVSVKKDGPMWSARCGKGDVSVVGFSEYHALYNAQVALNYSLACQGMVERLSAPVW
jgi:hypothetical protein